VRGRHSSVVKLLIDAGCDLDQTDSSGETALSIAEGLRDTATVALLRKPRAR
jgi:ankyrin repeat protein